MPPSFTWMLMVHLLLLSPFHQISAMFHPKIGGGSLHKPALNRLSVPPNPAAIAVAAPDYKISFPQNAKFTGITSITSHRGDRLQPKVASNHSGPHDEAAKAEQHRERWKLGKSSSNLSPSFPGDFQNWPEYYRNMKSANAANVAKANSVNANAANANHGKEPAEQDEQECRDYPTKPIAEIEKTVASLWKKVPWNRSYGYTPEQLIKALEHTNRILKHNLSMCIVTNILEERCKTLSPGEEGNTRAILLNHIPFEQLKGGIFDILEINPQDECTEEFCDVDQGHHLSAAVKEVVFELTKKELNGALDLFKSMQAQVQQREDELVQAMRRKVSIALKLYGKAEQIYEDFGDWSSSLPDVKH